MRTKSRNFFSSIFILSKHISFRRKMQLLILLFLAFAMSFAELLTIGAVIPFMGILITPEKVFENDLINPIINFFEITESSQLILPLCIGFGIIALGASLVKLLQVYANTKFSMGLGSELATKIFTQIIFQSYQYHTNKNSSEFINGVVNKTALLMHNIILGLIQIVGGLIIISMVISGLSIINPIVTLISFGSLGLIYFLLAFIARRVYSKLSNSIANFSTRVIQIIQESYGGIRDVIISSKHDVHSSNYRKADIKLRTAQGWALFVAASPRYLIEGIALLALSFICYVIASNGDISESLPFMVAIVLGAQRLLPIMQQIWSAYSSININRFALDDSIEFLEMPKNNETKIVDTVKLTEKINLKDVNFSYENSSNKQLDNINICFLKGQKIGIIGETGSGKSTLLDLLMGLLRPESGYISIDDKILNSRNIASWHSLISHVPQTIFLIDGTIAENIALTDKNDFVDLEKVINCAKLAKIDKAISGMSDGYNTRVGERGVKLSGGQRQRIGIARALYSEAQVIILDEATSALDLKTELEVMESIEKFKPNLTYFIVAHRISTLKNCDVIVHLEEGRIAGIKSYKDIEIKA